MRPRGAASDEATNERLVALLGRGPPPLTVEICTRQFMRQKASRVLIGLGNDLPCICPATDRETTGTHPTRRGTRGAGQTPFRGQKPGRRDVCDGLIIRWSRFSRGRPLAAEAPMKSPTKSSRLQRFAATRETRVPRMCSSEALLRPAATHETSAMQFFFAKVGVAGSNPVVRSRESVDDQHLLLHERICCLRVCP
jgi:hypothetical protein